MPCNKDRFCYVCGQFDFDANLKVISDKVRNAYEEYFGFNISIRSFSPTKICSRCFIALSRWKDGSVTQLKFGVPMLWRHQKDHTTDCYFCLTNVTGHTKKTKSKIQYPSVQSVTKPIPHSDAVPIPEKPNSAQTATEQDEDSDDPQWLPEDEEEESHKFAFSELKDLVRDLKLSKDGAELLASRLKQKKCLMADVHVTYFRDRHEEYVKFYNVEDGVVFCDDIPGLFLQHKHPHVVSEWRLFIDSNVRSMKFVLLHNGNTLPSIPIAYVRTTVMQEEYDVMKLILNKIKYNEFQWYICSDFKIVQIVTGTYMGNLFSALLIEKVYYLFHFECPFVYPSDIAFIPAHRTPKDMLLSLLNQVFC